LDGTEWFLRPPSQQPDEVFVSVVDLGLIRLRSAIRNNRVSFPSQVPGFASEPGPDIQWRIVELYFVQNWSANDLGKRYCYSSSHIRKIISQWVFQASALGYLQEIRVSDEIIDTKTQSIGQARNRDARALPQELIFFGPTCVDLAAHTIKGPGRDFHLTNAEWAVLQGLASQRNRRVHRCELVKLLQGSRAQKGEYLRRVISNLRQKLEPDPANPQYIITKPALGYTLQVPKDAGP
jgi:DNA-binding winged helix-turn-helix (wHTH) protein